MERIGDCQTQCTQRCIAGGNRKYDNAEQCNNTANASQQMLTYYTNRICCKRRIRCLQSKIVYAHCACCPYHSDEALYNHHVVECHTSLLLALYCTGNDCSLCRMEAGKDSAGYRNKEYRNKVVGCKIVTISNNRSVPCIPNLCQRIALYKDTNKYADCREQQDCTEYRIDSSDNRINREYCRDQIIQENNTVNNPCRNRSCRTVKTKYLLCCNIARRIDKYRANQ